MTFGQSKHSKGSNHHTQSKKHSASRQPKKRKGGGRRGSERKADRVTAEASQDDLSDADNSDKYDDEDELLVRSGIVYYGDSRSNVRQVTSRSVYYEPLKRDIHAVARNAIPASSIKISKSRSSPTSVYLFKLDSGCDKH